jgi:glycosyltransferase involved in cell wall biosynthesis
MPLNISPLRRFGWQPTKMPTADVSLIMTVRNEATTLPGLFESLLRQTVLPAEIVIVDGGSTDGTPDIARKYSDTLPIRVIEKPGANISEGRNAAIEAANYPVIAVTDAGVRLDPGWLECLVTPLLDERGDVDVVSGFFVPDPQTPFERAMGATVLPTLADIEPDTFLPSSRSVAFRKAAWEAVGGYPEWLDYCEDLVFDMRLKDLDKQFLFAPQAVAHFRPRSSLRAFYLQYYRYARGDGKADLWRKRHAIRYLTYTLGPIFAFLSWRNRHSLPGKTGLALILAASAAYCARPYRRLVPMVRDLPPLSRLRAVAMVPVIRLTGDIAKMAGYPAGLVWRLLRYYGHQDS